MDKTLNQVSSVTPDQYHGLVLGLIGEGLRKYVQKKWTQAVYEDPEKQVYPIRATVDDILRMAREAKRAEKMIELKGITLPSCDIVSFRGGRTGVVGCRVNILVEHSDGKFDVRNLSVFGEHVQVWTDKDLPMKERRKVQLPLYRRVTVLAEEREFNSKYGKLRGWNLSYLKTVHSPEAVSLDEVGTKLNKCINALTLDELKNQGHLNWMFKTIVLKDVRWRHAESIDEWILSKDEFNKVEVMDSSTGKPKMAQDPASGRMIPQYKMTPKRVKTDVGQPFIQTVIGTGEENIEPVDSWTMSINVSDVSDDKAKNERAQIDFQNYRYGKPQLAMFSLDTIIESARNKGNHLDPDPTKNPFSVINSAYRGSPLIACVNLSKYDKSMNPQTKDPIQYWTFTAGLVMYRNHADMKAEDKTIPPMPIDFPDDLFVEETIEQDPEPEPEPEPEPTPIPKAKPKAKKKKPKPKVKPKPEPEPEPEPEEEKVSEEDMVRSPLPKQDNDSFLASCEKVYGLIEKKSPNSLKLSDATAGEFDLQLAELLRQGRITAVNGNEFSIVGSDEGEEPEGEEPEPDEGNKRIKDVEKTIRQLIIDFPDQTFETLFELGTFPDWVTTDHKALISGIIDRIKKETA